MIKGASTMGDAHLYVAVEVRAKINKTNAAVRIETPKMSSWRNFDAAGFRASVNSGFSCFGIRSMLMKEIGVATSVANQKTHGHDAYWTSAAPMRMPRTERRTIGD